MSKKNKISEQEVKKIAELSRLSLTNEELKKRTKDMNNILDYMDTLNEIDTENVEELESTLKNLFKDLIYELCCSIFSAFLCFFYTKGLKYSLNLNTFFINNLFTIRAGISCFICWNWC